MGLFEIGQDKAHAALLTFGNESKVVFDFNAIQDLDQNLKPQIDSLSLASGQGTLADGLALACDKIFCKARGTRDTVPKVYNMLLFLHISQTFLESFLVKFNIIISYSSETLVKKNLT